MAKPPALRVVQLNRECSKLYCSDCQHFLGLQHEDGESPVMDHCPDGRKTCAAQDTLNEFQERLQKQLMEEEAQRVLFDTLLDDNPFNTDGDTL
jgi:hypothetical protein